MKIETSNTIRKHLAKLLKLVGIAEAHGESEDRIKRLQNVYDNEYRREWISIKCLENWFMDNIEAISEKGDCLVSVEEFKSDLEKARSDT